MVQVQVEKGARNILMVLQSDYPPDIRLTKEIQALSQHGYQIFLLCHNKAGRMRLEQLDGATIIRLRHFNAISRYLTGLVNIPLFLNPVWIWAIARNIVRHKIDVIHVHDLPLAWTAIMLARLFGKKSVFDIHENYPAALRIWGKKGFMPSLFRNPRLAEILEGFCLRQADALIVVADEHRVLLMSRGVPQSKIVVVDNTVDYDQYTSIRMQQEIIDRYAGQFVMGYVGKFGIERDLETAVRAVKVLRAEIPNIRLLLVGDGPNSADLRQLAQQEGVANHVEFTGWVDFSATASYINVCTICIIPQPSNDLIDYGVPHKLFQYMALGKPVLCSDSKALARIVSSSHCGEIFASQDVASFSEAARKIARSQIAYGENGIRAIKTRYNWNYSSQVLLRLYLALTKA